MYNAHKGIFMKLVYLSGSCKGHQNDTSEVHRFFLFSFTLSKFLLPLEQSKCTSTPVSIMPVQSCVWRWNPDMPIYQIGQILHDHRLIISYVKRNTNSSQIMNSDIVWRKHLSLNPLNKKETHNSVARCKETFTKWISKIKSQLTIESSICWDGKKECKEALTDVTLAALAFSLQTSTRVNKF
jgi:hypothetical protein